MEIARNPEEIKQIRIAELEKQIKDIEHLLTENLVSGGARDKLIPSLAEYKKELAQLKGEPEQPEEQEQIAA